MQLTVAEVGNVCPLFSERMCVGPKLDAVAGGQHFAVGFEIQNKVIAHQVRLAGDSCAVEVKPDLHFTFKLI